MQCHQTFK
uniref:Uncharacterized protein n=1 Tax=Arundo donax TaxID=35708 RepID=A0A0A9HN75_ARUDO